MPRVAFITGITGQDGSYLAELLLEKGYQVYGLVRRTSAPQFERIEHLLDKIILLEGDLTDLTSLEVALETAQPDEIYNLAAQSFVGTSWKQPILTGDVTGLGAVRVFEAARRVCPKAKIYQASSSEMFGHATEVPQKETTPFNPQSPYACAKVFAHYMAQNYRKSYGQFIACGICFNHESPRRGIEFVTRKITDGVARIKLGLSKELRLGNLEAKRDWGFAGDYVKAMWLMLQQDEPDDFVIATGESHSVKEFVELAFSFVDLDWKKYVVIDERFYRPVDVPLLQGDPSKAKRVLGWEAETSFEELVKMMVEHDLERLQRLHQK